MRYKDNLCKACGQTFQVEFRRGTDRDYCGPACQPPKRTVRNTNPCSVPGCDRPGRSPKMTICDAHYCRLRRVGSLGERPITIPERKPLHCTVAGCSKPVASNKMCSMHRARQDRHGSPEIVTKPVLGSAWLDTADSYATAHARVNNIRGMAHMCERCGNRACDRRYQWAIKLSAQATAKHSRFGPYSMDINDYEQLCIPCHKSMDMTAIRSGARHHSIKTAREDRG